MFRICHGPFRAALALSVIVSIVVAAPAAWSGGYFDAVDDLPIPEPLTEVADQSLVFDSPAGRIVAAVAVGPMSVDAVRAYYRGALPPLGWEARGADRYEREGEILVLGYEVADGQVSVRIRLSGGGR